MEVSFRVEFLRFVGITEKERAQARMPVLLKQNAPGLPGHSGLQKDYITG
jgi:hypothetical protein